MKIEIELSPTLARQLEECARNYGCEPAEYAKSVLMDIIPARHDAVFEQIEKWGARRPSNEQIAKEVIQDMGDRGTCCLGMKLRHKGLVVAEGIVQGNLTNYEYFARVQAAMIEFDGAKESEFEIEHGVMD